MTIQIDVIFPFTIGASLGAATGVRLGKEASLLVNRYFVHNVFFICLVFIPYVEYLLWAHTDWEFMFTYKYPEPYVSPC